MVGALLVRSRRSRRLAVHAGPAARRASSAARPIRRGGLGRPRMGRPADGGSPVRETPRGVRRPYAPRHVRHPSADGGRCRVWVRDGVLAVVLTVVGQVELVLLADDGSTARGRCSTWRSP